ncbi:unnamed protein product [Amoebophrya sp. A25]|nr:unnamed protein product [Amoebophrya sp. A25]|eukprot:GSA25T00009472001.1
MTSTALMRSASADVIKPGKGAGRLREYDTILKGMPSAQWVLEENDFFRKEIVKPQWNEQTMTFQNVGCCSNGRSYFDRWRDRPSEHASKVGQLRSTWLIDNPPIGDHGPPKLKSPAMKILYSHVHARPTPKEKFVTKDALVRVVLPEDPIPRPDIIAGIGYGMKYNSVAHSDFREYFGQHRQHKTLQKSVEEGNLAVQRQSLEKAGLLEEALPSRKQRLLKSLSTSQIVQHDHSHEGVVV